MKALFILIIAVFFLNPISTDCIPDQCKDKCCLNGQCVDDVFVCPLKTNKNFDALIASLSIVAFFTIGFNFLDKILKTNIF